MVEAGIVLMTYIPSVSYGDVRRQQGAQREREENDATDRLLAEGEPGEVFARTALIEQAGLSQPWLVKLHAELGLPLCKTEAEFFRRMREKGTV